MLERAIAAGKSEDEVVSGIQANHHEEVRKLYRTVKTRKEVLALR